MEHGEEYNQDYYLQRIKDSDIIKGLTLSGGEPFIHAKELLPLVREVKKLGKDIWAYTGYTLEELMLKSDKHILGLLSNVDVLVDGRFIEELKDPKLKFRGSSNQRIIDMNKFRECSNIKECLMF